MKHPRVTARLTAQGWAMLVASLALFAIGLGGGQHPLLAWLALSMLVAFAIAAVLVPRRLRRVRGDWILPSSAHAGAELTVAARLQARGGCAPIVLGAWNPGSGVVEAVAPLPGLSAASTRVAWVLRFPQRGRCRLPPLEALGEQPFGLVRGRTAIGEPESILVLPSIGRVRREMVQELRHWLEDQLGGEDPGDDEIAYLRQYRPGDPRRRIHWRASARARTLLVTERQAPSSRYLALVIDTGERRRRSRRVERLIACAATLVDHLDREGWRVSLHGAFAPSCGLRGDRAYLLECLAVIEAGGCGGGLAHFLPDDVPTLVLVLDPARTSQPNARVRVLTLAEAERLVALPRTVR